MNTPGNDPIVPQKPVERKPRRYRTPEWLRAYPTIVGGLATLAIAAAEIIRALRG
jgi:hypothetical protein